jgi:hypothetical protein
MTKVALAALTAATIFCAAIPATQAAAMTAGAGTGILPAVAGLNSVESAYYYYRRHHHRHCRCWWRWGHRHCRCWYGRYW